MFVSCFDFDIKFTSIRSKRKELLQRLRHYKFQMVVVRLLPLRSEAAMTTSAAGSSARQSKICVRPLLK